MTTRIKICGLTRAEDMAAAAEAGADYVGLVFAEGSSRQVVVDDVAAWIEDARGDAEVVGVFRDQSFEDVLRAVDTLDLDFVQLHGHESGEVWKSLPVRMIETRIVGDTVPDARFAGAAWAHLLDAGAGSGTIFDWDLARELARSERVFLAGGLDPDNVADAVRTVRPFAVDVASGTEASPGRKDPARLRAFAAAVRAADAKPPREKP